MNHFNSVPPVVHKVVSWGNTKLTINLWNGSRWDLQTDKSGAMIMLNTVVCFLSRLNPEVCFSGTVNIASGIASLPVIEWNTDQTVRNIFLSAGDRYWCQQVYQLSHELTHFFIRGCTDEHNNWFYESIAELASNYFLLKMGEAGKNCPFEDIRSYLPALVTYQKGTVMSLAGVIPNAPQWLKKNEDHLLAQKTDRALNAEVAKLLFPYFQREKDIWNILLFAPHQNTRLDALLRKWEEAIPDHHSAYRRHIWYFRSVFFE